jgi:hypothetical protein
MYLSQPEFHAPGKSYRIGTGHNITRVVYVMEKCPDGCSPRDLKLETSKYGVDVGAGLELDLDRIFTIEDLMLRTPNIQTMEIERLSSLIFPLSLYTVNFAAPKVDVYQRSGFVGGNDHERSGGDGASGDGASANGTGDVAEPSSSTGDSCCMTGCGYRNDDAAVMGKATDNAGAELGTGGVTSDVGLEQETQYWSLEWRS